MDDIVLARALHVLSLVHWIGGVAFVTLVALPLASARGGAHGRCYAWQYSAARAEGSAHGSTSILTENPKGRGREGERSRWQPPARSK